MRQILTKKNQKKNAEKFTGNRKYKQTSNSDGSISLEDTTEYTQEGDIFAAKDINDTNTAVNANAKAIADLTPKVNTNTSSIDTLLQYNFRQALATMVEVMTLLYTILICRLKMIYINILNLN